MVYPGSTPELRVLQRLDGTYVLQVRYINIAVGYKSKWQNVPVVKEQEQEQEQLS